MNLISIGGLIELNFDFGLLFPIFALSVVMTTIGGILGLINNLNKDKKIKKVSKFTKFCRLSIIIAFISIILVLSEIYNNVFIYRSGSQRCYL